MEWHDDGERRPQEEKTWEQLFLDFHFCMTGTAFAYFTTHSTWSFGRVAGVHQISAVSFLAAFSGLSPLHLGLFIFGRHA